MIEKQLIANNPYIHARPTSVIVNEAAKFKGKIFFVDGDEEVDAKSMLGMISFLGRSNHENISVKADGTQALEAVQAIEKAYNAACISQLEAELSSIKNSLLPDADPDKVESVRAYLKKSYKSDTFADIIKEINEKYRIFTTAQKAKEGK